jgi:hypothetical protein
MEEEKKELPAATTEEIVLKDKTDLNKESIELLNQVIDSKTPEEQKDLTYLFNLNQNKKTMLRVNKCNDLLDAMTDQLIRRVTTKPDNISNQDLLQSLKVIQDMVERGQNQVKEVKDQPLIQINQQNNEIKMDGDPTCMSKDSRDRIKNAVASILGNLGAEDLTKKSEVIDVETKEEEIQDEHK